MGFRMGTLATGSFLAQRLLVMWELGEHRQLVGQLAAALDRATTACSSPRSPPSPCVPSSATRRCLRGGPASPSAGRSGHGRPVRGRRRGRRRAGGWTGSADSPMQSSDTSPTTGSDVSCSDWAPCCSLRQGCTGPSATPSADARHRRRHARRPGPIHRQPDDAPRTSAPGGTSAALRARGAPPDVRRAAGLAAQARTVTPRGVLIARRAQASAVVAV